MLGNSALSQTPFSALGGGVVYTRYVQATAVSSDSVAAVAAFSPSVMGASTATDSSAVGPSIFVASVAATAQGVDVGSTAVDFAVSVVGAASGSGIVTVDPSIFSADVSAAAAGGDAVLANALFIAVASDGALGVDAVTRRLLWEIINDNQTSNWSVVKTQL